MKFTFMFAVLLSSVFAHADVGFSGGNEMTAVLAEGDITVQCQRGIPNVRYVRCRQDILVGGEYDYFKGPQGVFADEVTLVARHEDGSSRTKKVDYDSSKGRTAKRINLWIHTLLQKPLLDEGVNDISYKMTRGSKVTANGTFKAIVKDGGRKICRRHGYYNEFGSDCNNPERFCSQYFSENNYCL